MTEPGALSRRIAQIRSELQDTGSLSQFAPHTALLMDLAALSACLDATRRDIEQLDIPQLAAYLPQVRVDLHAVTDGTAEAADSILDSCEQLDYAASTMPDDCHGVIRQATTRIFEACGFQDIAGQRIARIGRILEALDVKLAEIVGVFGRGLDAPAIEHSEPSFAGPQLARHAMSQRAVDALLAMGE